ncbi:MAG TPA: hypothetical protein VGK66_01410 [Solirubrobacterales bacterium]|nr:hypothetical protein [Solirubrobacterales bacterium]
MASNKEPIADPLAEARKAVDRMRDLAKWLVVVLGAIGGVVVAGSQLSELGSSSTRLLPAIAGVAACLVGAGLAIGFTASVLLPVRLTVAGLAVKKHSPVKSLVEREPDVLGGTAKSIPELAMVRQASIEDESSALDALRQDPNNPALRTAAEEKMRVRELIGRATQRFLGVALMTVVKRRMARALVALGLGSVLVVAGIALFSWATHSDVTAQGEDDVAVPKRPSPVIVRLSAKGRESLAPSLGDNCNMSHLQAIALGGSPNAVEMVSVPSGACHPVRFTLTNSFGTSVNNERVRVPNSS